MAKSYMKKWRCSKCETTIEAIAKEVTHRCPKNKNLNTKFELVEEK